MRFLVTAGNTRQPIDRVRDWGNVFTGNTGYAIARTLMELGEVDLLTSNRTHLAEIAAAANPRLRGQAFSTHAELKEALQQAMNATVLADNGDVSEHRHRGLEARATTLSRAEAPPGNSVSPQTTTRSNYDAVFMTAAVADYTPDGTYTIVERQCLNDGITEKWTVRNVQAGKVKSSYDRIAVVGKRTEKLVDLFRKSWGYRGMLVKFKLEVGLEVDELLKIGENSRLASGADYLVANTLEMVNGLKPGAYLLRTGGHEWVDRDRLPSRLAQLVGEHYQTVRRMQ
ncbi:MAG: phosphopantothenoylcysteine decarboxylase [Tepidisphaeraceae bacterium]|jgi:phosphopantothenoylcysteine synthetase/decarboxylase